MCALLDDDMLATRRDAHNGRIKDVINSLPFFPKEEEKLPLLLLLLLAL
jgi:hypothetical protein